MSSQTDSVSVPQTTPAMAMRRPPAARGRPRSNCQRAQDQGEDRQRDRHVREAEGDGRQNPADHRRHGKADRRGCGRHARSSSPVGLVVRRPWPSVGSGTPLRIVKPPPTDRTPRLWAARVVPAPRPPVPPPRPRRTFLAKGARPCPSCRRPARSRTAFGSPSLDGPERQVRGQHSRPFGAAERPVRPRNRGHGAVPTRDN